MASKVDITIKAKDEASGVIDGINDSFGGLGESALEVEETGGAALGNFMDKANETMLGVAAAIYVAKEAFAVLGEVYDATVGKTLEIAGEVEELSRVSGDLPENMSLLRIEAEKAAVPFDDLYKAMENLNKNGVAPTIDNLVAIADEYVRLQDPIAQAALLTENFGSAGDEIAPMLEAIAGGVTAVDDAGLIFTDAEIQAAKDYEENVTELKQSWEGFALSIGTSVMPALSDLLTTLGNFSLEGTGGGISGFLTGEIESIQQVLLQIQLVDLALSDSSLSIPEKMELVWKAIGTSNTPDVEELQRIIGGLTGELEGVPSAAENAAAAINELNVTALENSGMIEVFGSNAKRAGGAIREFAGEFQDLDVTGTRAVKAIALEMASLEEQLANANLELAIQVRTFREDIGGQLYDMLRNAGLEGEDLELRIATLDTVLGTTFGKEYALELAIDDLFQQLLTDPEGFAEAFGSFEDAFFPLQESAQEAMTKVMDLQAQLDALEGEYNATINITTNGTVPNFGGGGGGGGGGRGGDVSIPGFWASGGVINAAAGVAAGLSHYWVGERGPEPFFPSVDGRIVSNTQAMAALRGGDGMDAEAIGKAVARALSNHEQQEARKNVAVTVNATVANDLDLDKLTREIVRRINL